MFLLLFAVLCSFLYMAIDALKGPTFLCHTTSICFSLLPCYSPINETSEAFPICGVWHCPAAVLPDRMASSFWPGISHLSVLRLKCLDTRRLQKGAAEVRKNYLILVVEVLTCEQRWRRQVLIQSKRAGANGIVGDDVRVAKSVIWSVEKGQKKEPFSKGRLLYGEPWKPFMAHHLKWENMKSLDNITLLFLPWKEKHLVWCVPGGLLVWSDHGWKSFILIFFIIFLVFLELLLHIRIEPFL